MQRLTTSSILERLAAFAESNGFDPREPAKLEIPVAAPQKPPPPMRPAPPAPSSTAVGVHGAPPPRPAPPVGGPGGPPSRPVPMPPHQQLHQGMAQKLPGQQGSGAIIFLELQKIFDSFFSLR